MAEQEDRNKKVLEIENLEVAELEDEDLEGVAGGTNTCTNTNCPCYPHSSEPTNS